MRSSSIVTSGSSRWLSAVTLVTLLGLAPTGCGEVDPCAGKDGTCVAIFLNGAIGKVDAVHIDLSGAASHGFTSNLPAAQELPVAIPLLLKAGVSGGLQISAVALAGGSTVAVGSATVTLVPGGKARIDVTLAKVGGPTCMDKARDGSETDVDCGGSCAACADGKRCGKPADCASGVCNAGKCIAATCVDGASNGKETDIDCGGGCPSACADGNKCLMAGDCKSGVCDPMSHLCAMPSCMDGAHNGPETDLDCGGACGPCADGKKCLVAADCRTGVCDSMARVCVGAGCGDGVRNGSETDTDCGGNCAPCTDGKACVVPGDCKSASCVMNSCAKATCLDKIANGGESDVDCGGPCPACKAGSKCGVNADCLSMRCANNLCQAPGCGDGVLNGTETDIDCGGLMCGPCAVGQGCMANRDCVSNSCVGGKCAPSCMDGMKNGAETDVDCGGGVCSPCPATKRCLVAKDCASGVCTGGVCVAPACNDNVKNGLETDLDCGGLCPRCKDGLNCKFAGDCTSGNCKAAVCSPLFAKAGTTVLLNDKATRNIEVADFNGDKLSDVVTALAGGGQIAVVLGDGLGGARSIKYFLAPLASGMVGVALCDYNRDGILDVVTANTLSNNISFLKGDGGGGFSFLANVSTEKGPSGLACGDLVAMGPTAVTANSVGNSVSASYSFNPPGNLSPIHYPTSPGPRTVTLLDFNRDGSLDAAVPLGPGGVDLLINDGVGRLTRRLTLKTSGGCNENASAADFNGDGFVDLAVNNGCNGGGVDVFLNDKLGTFLAPVTIKTVSATVAVVAADLNGDGRIDIATNGFGPSIAVSIGNGDGTFGAALGYDSGGVLLTSLRAADIKGNGMIGLVGGDNNAGIFFLLSNR